MKNKGITLIGMPGVGKSTVGKKLAKTLNKEYVDLDELIYKKSGISDMTYFKRFGEKAFLELEEKLALELSLKDIVFAPGGSIIYSKIAMEKIKNETFVVYLQIEKGMLKKRLSRIIMREIVGLKELGFDKLFENRSPLYEKYADLTVNINKQSINETIKLILNSI
ncbi:MAG TPA: shikimate kinase [Xanthomonadales bacterium]|nr:shikimate kinase [Xanthomonadales bacterium]